MTPEAKQAVMQLMGQTYGQLKKQDDMLVGQSGNLQPKSLEMKQMVEQLVASPTVAAPNQPAPVPQAAPAPAPVPEAAPAPQGPPSAPVTPEQAMLELHQAAPAPAPVVEEQGMFDFSEPSGIDKLIELQKETNLLLKGIKLQLENSNVRPKRKTAVKKAKSSVA